VPWGLGREENRECERPAFAFRTKRETTTQKKNKKAFVTRVPLVLQKRFSFETPQKFLSNYMEEFFFNSIYKIIMYLFYI
jgi:hypothetical protein